jgi:hypothetical protein
MLLIYLPALIFEGFCEMLLEPMQVAASRRCDNGEPGDLAMRGTPLRRLATARRDLA